jgi:integrase
MPAKLRAGVVLAAWGALRIGQILALEKADIDLVAGRVSISKNSGRDRFPQSGGSVGNS